MPSGSCPSARCSILMQGWQALVATAFFLQASSNVFPSHAPRPRYASGPRAFLLPATSGHQQFQFEPQAAPADLMSPSSSCVHASMLLFPIAGLHHHSCKTRPVTSKPNNNARPLSHTNANLLQQRHVMRQVFFFLLQAVSKP